MQREEAFMNIPSRNSFNLWLLDRNTNCTTNLVADMLSFFDSDGFEPQLKASYKFEQVQEI